MAPNICPWMKLQTGVRVIFMMDIIGTIIFIFMITSSIVHYLVFNNNDVEQQGIPDGKTILFVAIHAFLTLGILFYTQIMMSIYLYKAAAKNDDLTRGCWPWLEVTIFIILLFFFLFIEGLQLVMLVAFLFLLITIYKIFVIMVIILFERSMEAQERAPSVVFNSQRGGQPQSGSDGTAQVV